MDFPLGTLIAPGLHCRRADEIANRIENAVYIGLIDDDERLPTEIDLAAQFGVAPMTVRDALAALRKQGLVVTRRGRSGGSFVRRPAEPPVDASMARLTAMSASELRDVFDEHAAVAGRAAFLAAGRSAPHSVRRLFTLVDLLVSVGTGGDRIRADSRFHINVAAASQSARLTRREAELQAEVAAMVWLPLGRTSDIAEHAEQHHAITAAIASENGPEARRLAEEHELSQLTRLMQEKLDAVSDRVDTDRNQS